MKKFIDLMNASITKVKYIAVLVAAVSAALAAFHTQLENGLNNSGGQNND